MFFRRQCWHIHRASSGGGQLLLCTAGRGWYQAWGQAPRALKPGDVVRIPAGVKHWLAVAVYGAFAFGKRDMRTNLLLRNEFVFLDYGESPLWFYLDHTTMLGLFIFLGYHGNRTLRKPVSKGKAATYKHHRI